MRLSLTTSLIGHAVLAAGVLWIGPAVMDRPIRQVGLPAGGSVIVELVAPEPGGSDQQIGDRREHIARPPTRPVIYEPVAAVEPDALHAPAPPESAAASDHHNLSMTEEETSPPTLVDAHSAAIVTASAPQPSMQAALPPPAPAAGMTRAPAGVAPSDGTSGDAWNEFFAGVHAAIEQAKRYPAIARRAGMEDRVEVSFVITGSGETAQLRVKAPSRYPILNRAAIETIERVERFPPPPLEAGREHVRLTVPLVFSLHGSLNDSEGATSNP